MKVDDLYLRGLIACFTSPTVPPEVLIASARLLAQIDHGSVDLILDGDRAVLSYHGATLAELTEQVPGASVRVVVSLGVGSPAEMLITRAPIEPGIIALCQMGLDGATRNIDDWAPGFGGGGDRLNGGRTFTSDEVEPRQMIDRTVVLCEAAISVLGCQPTSVTLPAQDLVSMRMSHEGDGGPSAYDVIRDQVPWLDEVIETVGGPDRRHPSRSTDTPGEWIFRSGDRVAVVVFQ